MRLLETASSLFAAGLSVDAGPLLPTGRLTRVPVTPLVGSHFWLPDPSVDAKEAWEFLGLVCSQFMRDAGGSKPNRTGVKSSRK